MVKKKTKHKKLVRTNAKESRQKTQPKNNVVSSHVESSGNMTFRQVAKLLKIKEPVLRAFLSDHGVMYKLGGRWMPSAQHINTKRFDVERGEKNGHAYTRPRFTPEGVKWLTEKLAAAKTLVCSESYIPRKYNGK